MSVRMSLALGLAVPTVAVLSLSERLAAPPLGITSNEGAILRPGSVLAGLAEPISRLLGRTGRSEVAVVVCRSRSSCADSASLPSTDSDVSGHPVIYLYPDPIPAGLPGDCDGPGRGATLVVGDPGRSLVEPAWYALAPLAVRVDAGGRVMRAFPLGRAMTTADVQRLVWGPRP